LSSSAVVFVPQYEAYDMKNYDIYIRIVAIKILIGYKLIWFSKSEVGGWVSLPIDVDSS
jgi:hypothetical protein